MSDYTQLTFFAPKDALASGNPSKLIKGAEVDPELNAISVAIASKFDVVDVASDAEAAALTSDIKIITPDKLLSALTGGTFTAAVGLVNNLTAEASLDQAADYLLVYDASAGVLRKATPAAIATAVGSGPTSRQVATGAGLSGGGDLSGDRTLILDTASTRNTDHAGVSISAGTGLSGGGTIEASRTLSVDRTGTDTNQVGYLDLPPNFQPNNYTLVMTDRGKAVTHNSGGGGGHTFTIPSNASVPFPLMTAITIVNDDPNPITIAITSDTLQLAGTSSTGSRTLAAKSFCTLLKVSATGWYIAGPGVS
jgi:hypothetical protein